MLVPSKPTSTTPTTRQRPGAAILGGVFLGFLALGILASPPDPTGSAEGAWVGEAWNSETRMLVTLDVVRAGEAWYGAIVLPDEDFLRFEPDSIQVRAGSIRVVSDRPQMVIQAPLSDEEVIAGQMTLRGKGLEIRLFRGGTPEAAAFATEVGARAQSFREDVTLDLAVEGPAMQHVAQDRLDDLLESAETSFSTSLVILRDGELVGEWYRGGESRRVQAMSVTKVALNLMAGRLVTTGALSSLDTPVHHYFPEWSSGPQSRVTVRHLLAHTSGLPPGVPTPEIYQATDVVRYALNLPLEAEPGRVLSYSNNGTNLLAGVLGRIAGEPVDDFLRNDLFAHLGIEDFAWIRDGNGNPHGMAGLSIHARDLARVGQFALNHGEWNGEELIDRSWFEESFREAGEGAEGVGMLEGRANRVGLLWLLLRGDAASAGDGDGEIVGVMHSGDLGQWLVIYPEEGLVGVRMVQYSPAYSSGSDTFREFGELLRRLSEGAPPEPQATGSASDSRVAFVGVTVLPMLEGHEALSDYTVIVQDGRIAQVGPSGEVEVGEGTHVVDGGGRWLLPGLAEMHAHLPPPGTSADEMADLLFLYLANGVTTIRTMLGAPNHLEVREAVAEGRLLGPTILAAAPSLSGNSAPDPETAERAVRFLSSAGYDLLKLHPGLSRESYDRIVEVARDEGMTWAGHVSVAVGLEHSLATGKSTVDHLDGYLEAAASDEIRRRLEAGEAVLLADILSSVTQERFAEVSRSIAGAGVWSVPTMYLWERFYDDASSHELECLPEMRFASPTELQQWRGQKDGRVFVNLLENWRSGGALGANDVPDEVARALIAFRREMLASLDREGAPLLLGTDSPQMFMIPGFAIHHEIRVMAESGVSPRRILESGSRNVAKYVASHLGGDGSFGSIVPGARADMILVEGDPLEDLGRLEDPVGVMVRGTWLPRELIRARLEAIAERRTEPNRLEPAPPHSSPGTSEEPPSGVLRDGGMLPAQIHLTHSSLGPSTTCA